MDINEIITDHTLYIDSTLEDFIKIFCNTEGFNQTITKDRFILGSWYEGYIYCLLIGINTNRRHFDGYGKKTEKARHWSPYFKEQYKYAIAKLIHRPDILKELKIDTRINVDEHYTDLSKLLENIKNICDQFSLGGVRYLKEKYDKDDNLFNGYNALKRIYEDTLIKNEN